MKDKVIVITGASGGIGAAVARLAGARGAKLVLAARRGKELGVVAAASGGEATTESVVADVTRRADVNRIFRSATGRFGGIDVWINNAGRGITRMVSELTDDDIDDMMRDNVKSALYGMQAVLPHFRERRRGHIINVSSLLGRVPFAPFRSAYSAAKHALNALSGCLRGELRADFPGIMVSTVLPGPVATDFGANALGGGPDSRQLAGAQSADQVAEVILDVISHPRPDAYTSPDYQALVERYFHDIAAAEAQPPIGPPRP